MDGRVSPTRNSLTESKTTGRPAARASGGVWLAGAAVLVLVAAGVLMAMGRIPICKCGYVKVWHGIVLSAENSQHVSDWYTFSHVIHGFAFYALLWTAMRLVTRILFSLPHSGRRARRACEGAARGGGVPASDRAGVRGRAPVWFVARRWPRGGRFFAAVLLESAWEVFENTDFIINRYREATISLDYYGDSILNSVSDIAAMALGFSLAARLPVRATISITVALELFVLWAIRDNLTLNIIMLVYPLDAIRAWQGG